MQSWECASEFLPENTWMKWQDSNGAIIPNTGLISHTFASCLNTTGLGTHHVKSHVLLERCAFQKREKKNGCLPSPQLVANPDLQHLSVQKSLWTHPAFGKHPEGNNKTVPASTVSFYNMNI